MCFHVIAKCKYVLLVLGTEISTAFCIFNVILWPNKVLSVFCFLSVFVFALLCVCGAIVATTNTASSRGFVLAILPNSAHTHKWQWSFVDPVDKLILASQKHADTDFRKIPHFTNTLGQGKLKVLHNFKWQILHGTWWHTLGHISLALSRPSVRDFLDPEIAMGT